MEIRTKVICLAVDAFLISESPAAFETEAREMAIPAMPTQTMTIKGLMPAQKTKAERIAMTRLL